MASNLDGRPTRKATRKITGTLAITGTKTVEEKEITEVSCPMCCMWTLLDPAHPHCERCGGTLRSQSG